MPVPYPNVTRDETSWAFQKSYIERLMDHSALTSAHPDDTLVLAGPPRMLAPKGSKTLTDALLPLGMVQQMQVAQNKPTTPMQAIGSGRLFFVSGKAQGTASIARLFVNGRNLLRALYTNAVQSGIDPTKFDDEAAYNSGAPSGHVNKFFANLDSEMFLIPFGLAVFFRDKIHDEVAAFYLELCQLSTWAIAIGAGQTMILENVTMMFDRLRPWTAGAYGQASDTTNYNPDPQAANDSALFQTIFQATGITNAETGVQPEDDR